MSSYLPDISVIICSYNHERWIERCIRSISHQAHLAIGQYEIILINDGSTDNTKSVLENLRHLENLRIIDNKNNEGLPRSINKGIRMARGRYIVRVDSDDYVSRDFLYLMWLFMDKNKKYQAVATDYIRVDSNENFIEQVNCLEQEIACGVMFRKECLFDIGLYNEDFKMREGHELKRRFEQKFTIGRLEFPLYKYRMHSTNRTKNTKELSKYDSKLNVGENK